MKELHQDGKWGTGHSEAGREGTKPAVIVSKVPQRATASQGSAEKQNRQRLILRNWFPGFWRLTRAAVRTACSGSPCAGSGKGSRGAGGPGRSAQLGPVPVWGQGGMEIGKEAEGNKN